MEHLIDPRAEVLLAVDDTAHRRRGKQVHGAGWIHDRSAPGRDKLAFGDRWVVVGIIVRVPGDDPPDVPAGAVPPVAGQGYRLDG